MDKDTLRWVPALDSYLLQGRQLTGNKLSMASCLTATELVRTVLGKHTRDPISLGIDNSYFQGRTSRQGQEGLVGTA